MSTREVGVGSVQIGGKNPLALIAGPCVIEGEEHLLGIAERLQEICGKLEIPLVGRRSSRPSGAVSSSLKAPRWRAGVPSPTKRKVYG